MIDQKLEMIIFKIYSVFLLSLMAWMVGYSAVVNAVPSDEYDINLTWENPTTRADGSVFDPATEQQYNRIYKDCGSGLSLHAEIFTATAYQDTAIPYSCLTWSVTAVDTDGLESSYATPVVKKAPPGRVKNLQ